ncbi:MAG: hypothetical protein E6J02_13485 [Chloroflexi bacterium]|nr:MAG: hypothetical protein E6J02_13485 [Chloroflexota bacterium]
MSGRRSIYALVARALRPYALQIGFSLYIPFVLFVDGRITTIYEQYALGLLTFAVLFLAASLSPSAERRQVWLCVLVATGFEIFGSLIWGLYRYRFHNVPLYVPPGHGLVYLFGLTWARLPVMARHGRLLNRLALAAATCWALAGLTVLPALTGRLDVAGALCLPWFALHLHVAPGDPRNQLRKLALGGCRALHAGTDRQPAVGHRRWVLRDRRHCAVGCRRAGQAGRAQPLAAPPAGRSLAFPPPALLHNLIISI